MAKINNNGISITIIGILIAALGVIVPILWDWWKLSSEIALTIEHTVTIVEKKDDVEKLVVLYGSKQVNTLSKTSFELKNTGRTAIISEDLISNPRISLQKGNILEAEINYTIPKNIDKNLSFSENDVNIGFKLLNPGDTIKFSILSDINLPKFDISARIKNVKEIKVIEGETQIKVSGNISFLVYIVAGVSLIFFIAFIALLTEIPKLRKQLNAIKNAETPLHKGEQKDIIFSYIDIELSMLTKNKRERLKELIPKGINNLSEDDRRRLMNEIYIVLSNESPLAGAILAFIFTIIGVWYIFNSIFI